MKTIAYYFGAFVISAIVTYWLPGNNNNAAFVDAVAIIISLSLFGFGFAHAVNNFNKRRDQ